MTEREGWNDIALTEEELRQFKGFEHVDKERARAIIDTVKQFSIIAYDYYIQVKRREEKQDNYERKEKLPVDKIAKKKIEKLKRKTNFNKL